MGGTLTSVFWPCGRFTVLLIAATAATSLALGLVIIREITCTIL